jgi:Uma2 family endonuclease
MVADPQRQRISVEAYFQLEHASEIRHEYIDGYAYAMSGGTKAHSWLAMNMFRLLDEQLQSGPCRTYSSDVRVQLNGKRYVYPDVTVSCDIADHQEYDDVVRSPHLVIEVLSPTTELYDRGKKFAYYQESASIQEYVMINSQRQMIEVFRRKGEIWTYQRYRPGQTVEIESLDIQIPFASVYARIRVPIEEDDTSDESQSED